MKVILLVAVLLAYPFAAKAVSLSELRSFLDSKELKTALAGSLIGRIESTGEEGDFQVNVFTLKKGKAQDGGAIFSATYDKSSRQFFVKPVDCAEFKRCTDNCTADGELSKYSGRCTHNCAFAYDPTFACDGEHY